MRRRQPRDQENSPECLRSQHGKGVSSPPGKQALPNSPESPQEQVDHAGTELCSGIPATRESKALDLIILHLSNLQSVQSKGKLEKAKFTLLLRLRIFCYSHIKFFFIIFLKFPESIRYVILHIVFQNHLI